MSENVALQRLVSELVTRSDGAYDALVHGFNSETKRHRQRQQVRQNIVERAAARLKPPGEARSEETIGAAIRAVVTPAEREALGLEGSVDYERWLRGVEFSVEVHLENRELQAPPAP